MLTEIEKARRFMTEAEAKLKAHDKLFTSLTERIEKLEKQAASAAKDKAQ